MRIRTTNTKPQPCVKCKKPLDAATGIGSKRPQPGDITICFYCGHMLQIGKDMQLTSLSPAEFLRLPQELQNELGILRTFVEKEIAARGAAAPEKN
jgi:hypothetical protein